MQSEPVITWTSADGRRRAIVERQAMGFYRWYEEHLVEDEDYGAVYEYWRIAVWPKSGLYPSVQDAQKDAANELRWLGARLD